MLQTIAARPLSASNTRSSQPAPSQQHLLGRDLHRSRFTQKRRVDPQGIRRAFKGSQTPRKSRYRCSLSGLTGFTTFLPSGFPFIPIFPTRSTSRADWQGQPPLILSQRRHAPAERLTLPSPQTSVNPKGEGSKGTGPGGSGWRRSSLFTGQTKTASRRMGSEPRICCQGPTHLASPGLSVGGIKKRRQRHPQLVGISYPAGPGEAPVPLKKLHPIRPCGPYGTLG